MGKIMRIVDPYMYEEFITFVRNKANGTSECVSVRDLEKIPNDGGPCNPEEMPAVPIMAPSVPQNSPVFSTLTLDRGPSGVENESKEPPTVMAPLEQSKADTTTVKSVDEKPAEINIDKKRSNRLDKRLTNFNSTVTVNSSMGNNWLRLEELKYERHTKRKKQMAKGKKGKKMRK